MVAYQKKVNSSTSEEKELKLNQEMEKKRKIILRSFSLARDMYTAGNGMAPPKESDLEAGAEFLEVLLLKCSTLLAICYRLDGDGKCLSSFMINILSNVLQMSDS